MLLTVLLTGAITSVMKEAIARPGPIPDSPLVTGRSLFDERFGRFPSSHSAMTFGAASAVAAFLPAAAVPAFVLAVLVCYERLYRGTHFPSDIFAGIWIGLVSAQFVIAQLARRRAWRADLARERADRRAREAAAGAWPDEGPATLRPSPDDGHQSPPASPSA
jgi:membrane-associated phospholipid phosphatase